MKTKASILVAILLLNFALLAAPTTAAGEAMKAINPSTGDGTFYYYTNINPFLKLGDVGYPTGNQFTVNISIYNIIGLTAWQLNVTVDPTMLKIVSIGTPADHVFAGQSTFEGSKDINNTMGYVLWWVALGIGTTPVDVTEGRICTMVLERIAEPDRYGMLTCPIHIVVEGETTFFSKLEPDIAYTPTDGTYRYIWTPPDTMPHLEIRPSLTTKGGGAPIVGTPEALFNIDIYIRNLDKNWALIGLQWKIVGFNRSLIAPVSATEGPFLPGYAPNGTQFIYIDDGTELLFGDLIKPNLVDPPYWDLPDYPQANGVGGLVASMTWEVVYQGEFPWFDISAMNLDALYGEWGVDLELKYIPFEDPINGTVRVDGYILGRMIDVYTCYPYPYGGQGINKTSDMYWAQKTVCLCADVTYNLDPVQSKPVTIEVISPTGLHHFVFTAVTNETGTARIEFGLPWPCENPEDEIFGIWFVVVSVDIRCEIVKDYLWFKVWYRADIGAGDVKTTMTEYNKGEYVDISVTYWTWAEQAFPATIYVTITDDLDVPIASFGMDVIVGPAPYYCANWTDTAEFRLFLPKWAFVGTATIHVSILSALPSLCGTSYCPEHTATFRLLRPLI